MLSERDSSREANCRQLNSHSGLDAADSVDSEVRAIFVHAMADVGADPALCLGEPCSSAELIDSAAAAAGEPAEAVAPAITSAMDALSRAGLIRLA